MIRIGRWRVDIEVWQAPRAPRRRRVVLWGGGGVQFGSRADRELQLHRAMMSEMVGLRRLIAWSHHDHVHFGDIAVVPVAGWPEDTLIMVEPGSALPKGILSNIGSADAEKLAGYSGARGWLPGEDAGS